MRKDVGIYFDKVKNRGNFIDGCVNRILLMLPIALEACEDV